MGAGGSVRRARCSRAVARRLNSDEIALEFDGETRRLVGRPDQAPEPRTLRAGQAGSVRADARHVYCSARKSRASEPM
jgi:hypothetical protein